MKNYKIRGVLVQVDVTYVVSNNSLFRQHSLEEAVHGLLEFRSIVRNLGFDVQGIQRHSEFFAQAPESRETYSSSIKVVFTV
jgi:hypothetical protein